MWNLKNMWYSLFPTAKAPKKVATPKTKKKVAKKRGRPKKKK